MNIRKFINNNLINENKHKPIFSMIMFIIFISLVISYSVLGQQIYVDIYKSGNTWIGNTINRLFSPASYDKSAFGYNPINNEFENINTNSHSYAIGTFFLFLIALPFMEYLVGPVPLMIIIIIYLISYNEKSSIDKYWWNNTNIQCCGSRIFTPLYGALMSILIHFSKNIYIKIFFCILTIIIWLAQFFYDLEKVEQNIHNALNYHSYWFICGFLIMSMIFLYSSNSSTKISDFTTSLISFVSIVIINIIMSLEKNKEGIFDNKVFDCIQNNVNYNDVHRNYKGVGCLLGQVDKSCETSCNELYNKWENNDDSYYDFLPYDINGNIQKLIVSKYGLNSCIKYCNLYKNL